MLKAIKIDEQNASRAFLRARHWPCSRAVVEQRTIRQFGQRIARGQNSTRSSAGFIVMFDEVPPCESRVRWRIGLDHLALALNQTHSSSMPCTRCSQTKSGDSRFAVAARAFINRPPIFRMVQSITSTPLNTMPGLSVTLAQGCSPISTLNVTSLLTRSQSQIAKFEPVSAMSRRSPRRISRSA